MRNNILFTMGFGLIFVMLVVFGFTKTASATGASRWFGNDGRNAAMAGAGFAIGSGPGNLFLNPALMSWNPSGMWFNVQAAPSGLEIELDPRPDCSVSTGPCVDVPESIYDSRGSSWNLEQGGSFLDRPIPTDLLMAQRSDQKDIPTVIQLSLGYVDEIAIPEVRLGFAIVVPVPAAMKYRVWYNDEREQHFSNRLHFERFGEFDQIISLAPGLSYSPVEWFTFGAALQVDLGLAMEANLYLPNGLEFDYAYVSSSGEMVPILRPVVGLAFRTPIGLRFGLAYRHESYADVEFDARIRIWNGEYETEDGAVKKTIDQTHRLILGYEPAEVSLAAGLVIGPIQMEVGGAWQRYSGYLDRHGNDRTHPTMDSDDMVEESGWDSDWKDPRFNDVFTVRGGVEWFIVPEAAVRAGTAYFPSPMPKQTGRYNYVDNDLAMCSLGAGFRFHLFGRPVTIDVAAQIWHMRTLSVAKTKGPQQKETGGIIDEVPDTITDAEGETQSDWLGLQTNNPGFPGYTLKGIVFNGSLMMGMEFN